jgi:hypothetical protein
MMKGVKRVRIPLGSRFLFNPALTLALARLVFGGVQAKLDNPGESMCK